MDGTTDRSRGRRATGSTLAVGGATAAALVAGVWVGGWIAFETDHWQGFKSLVEGAPVGSALHVGLLFFLVAVGLIFVSEQ
jgi:hypothetical protein